MLSNQHYPHRANQKLRSWANAVFQNRGVCGQAVPSFPSPSPVIHFFFALVPAFLRSPPPPPSFTFFLLLSQLSRRTSRGNACYAGYLSIKYNCQRAIRARRQQNRATQDWVVIGRKILDRAEKSVTRKDSLETKWSVVNQSKGSTWRTGSSLCF